MLKPIKKPPFYTTEIPAEKTKYEIEALVKSFGAEGVQWTEVYDQRFVELKFILEIPMEDKPWRGIFSFQPKPLYEVKRVRGPYRRTQEKAVINWPATFRLLKNYLENMLNFISWDGIEAFQTLLGHAVLHLGEGRTLPVSEAIKHDVFRLSLSSLQALPSAPSTESKPKPKPLVIEAEVVEGDQQ